MFVFHSARMTDANYIYSCTMRTAQRTLRVFSSELTIARTRAYPEENLGFGGAFQRIRAEKHCLMFISPAVRDVERVGRQ